MPDHVDTTATQVRIIGLKTIHRWHPERANTTHCGIRVHPDHARHTTNPYTCLKCARAGDRP